MWAYNETFYQIYPIGFCDAPIHNDGICVPRIRKISEWSAYLQELGIGSIILNPIFESDNHDMILEIFDQSTAVSAQMTISALSVKTFTHMRSTSSLTVCLIM